METAWLAIKVIGLTAVGSAGPGLFIIDRLRLRWSPLEKLCGVFAASFICIYLASFSLFILNAGAWTYWATSAAFALMGLAGRRTAGMLIRQRGTRRALLAWVALLAWFGLHLALVRNFSGGDWQGDWREHYQRTQYFLHQFPDDYLFLGVYMLPARPPMMNAIAAFICRQTGLNFISFSLVFTFLNGWTFLPCCLLLRFFVRRWTRSIPVLAILFMLNPSIVENATLTWTKAFTAGMVVLGLCFYLRGRIIPAALALAAAMLSHYSAGPFALAIGLHCLYRAARRRNWRPPIRAGAAAGALLATWFAWSLWRFGPHVTFESNTTVTGTAEFSAARNLYKIGFNLISSTIPHPLRWVAYKPFSPPRNWGDMRDYYFTMCQSVLPSMIGVTAGAVALGLTMRFFRSPPRPWPRDKSFWLFFLLCTYTIGIAVNPGFNEFGLAYVTLQSLALIGVTLLAAHLHTLKPWVFRLVWTGLLSDYALGILLQFDRQSYVYPSAVGPDGLAYLLPDYTLGSTGAQEYLHKLRAGYVFLGDRLAGAGSYLEVASAVAAVCALWLLPRLRRRAPARQITPSRLEQSDAPGHAGSG